MALDLREVVVLRPRVVLAVDFAAVDFAGMESSSVFEDELADLAADLEREAAPEVVGCAAGVIGLRARVPPEDATFEDAAFEDAAFEDAAFVVRPGAALRLAVVLFLRAVLEAATLEAVVVRLAGVFWGEV